MSKAKQTTSGSAVSEIECDRFRHLIVALHHHIELTRHNTSMWSTPVGATPEEVTQALVCDLYMN